MPEGSYTILVVDDHEHNRELLCRRLVRHGYRVATAADGHEALQFLEDHSADLVLLDISMPGMDGYQVLDRLKRDAQWREIPVLMVTAIDDTDSVARCIELGADDYLTRPVNARLLEARVNACLNKRRLREQEQNYLRQIRAEQKRADDLLYDLLPHSVVQELKATGTVRPRRFHNVGVLFCDIVGFTAYCDERDPEEVVYRLQALFERFERVVAVHGMEKIKTIGDCFLATAGLMARVENPVLCCVRCGVEMIEAARTLDAGWEVRVGIHVGPVVAGLAGKRQYSFDLWGDTLNTAARVEKAAAPGTIAVSGPAWQHIADLCRGESLGHMRLKGKPGLEVFRFKRFLSTPGE